MKRILEFVRSVFVEFFPTVTSPTKTSGFEYRTKALEGAYREGKKAVEFNGRRSDNPYARGTAAFVAWDRGYLVESDKRLHSSAG